MKLATIKTAQGTTYTACVLTRMDGHRFHAVVVSAADTYVGQDGEGNRIVPREDSVRIFDAEYTGGDYWGELGQFTGASYYLSTVKEHGTRKLQLDGGIPVWHLDEKAMAELQEFLAAFDSTTWPTR